MKNLAGEKPTLPFWLSPTMVRFIPVSDEFTHDCVDMARSLPGRADVDDRDITVNKKIREAEKEWIPIIIVYGEKEKDSLTLPARIRSAENKTLSLDELRTLIVEQVEGYPGEGLAEPMLLSKRVSWK